MMGAAVIDAILVSPGTTDAFNGADYSQLRLDRMAPPTGGPSHVC